MRYQRFPRDAIDGRLDSVLDPLPNARTTHPFRPLNRWADSAQNATTDSFDVLRALGEDEAWDELNSPMNRVSIQHPPSPFRAQGNPPPIRHGEISTLNRAAIAYAQLVFHHFVGHFNPSGRLHPPLRPGCAGLALVHTTTPPPNQINQWYLYDVEYRVFDNTLRSVCWWGRLGNTGPPASAAQAGTHYENAVRHLLSLPPPRGLGVQSFQAKLHPQGPDLLAMPSYRPQIAGLCNCSISR